VPLRPDIDGTDWRMTIELPANLAAQVIPQGSITIDGISLTVAKIHQADENGAVRVEVAIIPHTYRSTNLHAKMAGEQVNIETDALAKYAAQQLTASAAASTTVTTALDEPMQAATHHAHGPEWLTAEYLLENGY
jgi:riboflavin synthase